MDLHGKIMNLPQTPGLPMVNATEAQLLAYKLGHRDARHAAAELALPYSAELPDDGELESWRKTADELLGAKAAGPSAHTLRRAAHLLQNAYLFAAKLRQGPAR
jgi:hypothetical protein